MAKKTERSAKGEKKGDPLTRALLLGFGLADLSREKLGAILKDVKKKHGITSESSRKSVDNLAKELQKHKVDTIKLVRKQLLKMASELERASKKKSNK